MVQPLVPLVTTTLLLPPAPTNVVSIRQSSQVITNCRPVTLSSFTGKASRHEPIQFRGAVQDSLHVRANRLIVLEATVESLGRVLVILQEMINVIFAVRTIQTTSVERRVEALPKPARVLLQLRHQFFDFLIIEPVRRILGSRDD